MRDGWFHSGVILVFMRSGILDRGILRTKTHQIMAVHGVDAIPGILSATEIESQCEGDRPGAKHPLVQDSGTSLTHPSLCPARLGSIGGEQNVTVETVLTPPLEI